jgi:predicted Rossmann fold flavoprotein
MYDVIVIGGGAAGMIAAGRAAERGRRVLLLEKNGVLGKKLSITGGGRCNITNHQEDLHALLQQYGSAQKFLYSSFAQFGVRETFSFFTERGLPLVTQAKQRVFPQSEKASDVVRCLETYLHQGAVTVQLHAQVEGFEVTDGKLLGVRVNGEVQTAESYILATGGASHPETGSTGDGFRWLADINHTIAQPTPAVVPIATSDSWTHQLSGTSFDDCKITFFVDGVKNFQLKGRILCTHFGLSGPLILNAATKIAQLFPEGEVTAAIDVLPTMDVGAADRHITSIFDHNKNRDLGNVMKIIAPTGTARTILSLLPELNPETKVHSVTKVQRKALATVLKSLPVHVTGLMGMDRAVIVDGGVVLEEIDGKTFRSKKYPELFIIGDVLHINRPSGGYSLQLCWTSGYVAGSAA